MATATMNDTEGKENSRMQMVLEKTDGTWKILTLTGSYCGVGRFIAIN